MPCSGPIDTATRFESPDLSVNVPSAWIHFPAKGSSVSNTSRSPCLVFCTPALRRLARMVGTKPSALGSCSAATSVRGRSWSGSSTRCGDRLSTVNRPVTRTLFLSSYGLS